MTTNLRLILAATLLSAGVWHQAGVAASAQAPAVVARDAWARQPSAQNVTGAFMTLENRSGATRAVVSASSDLADSVELHEMKMADGMMRMSPVKQIEIPAGGRVELKPGSLHIMVFGLKKPLALGDSIPITLTLDDGTKVSVTAIVRAPEPPK